MERINICKLCFEEFGDERRPRVLQCGHSYCTGCLAKLIKDGNLSCPTCKKNHLVASANYLTINYDLEESLSYAKIPKTQVATKVQSSTKFTKLQKLISEQKESIHNLILSADDMQSQLQEYEDFLLKKNKKHEEVLQKIRDLANLHEVLIKEVNEERKKVKDMQKEGEGCGKEVHDKLPNLDNATTNTAASAAVTDLVGCTDDLESWIGRCQQQFPYPKITFSQQVLKESFDALSSVDLKRNENVPMVSSSSNNDLTILEKVTEIGDNHRITLEKLQSNQSQWRNQIASGSVYAIHSRNGSRRSANLSAKDGKIYLHCLQDREIPAGAYTIEQTEVISYLEGNNSTVAFMDLAWDGSFKGRVHILLSPDTPLARHFRILCTGDLGPSYAHTKIYEVICINKANEALRAGDYEHNDGTGGAPVIEGLNKMDAIYTRSWGRGSVYITPTATGCQIAQFSVITGSGGGIASKIRFFGKVADGMAVLKAAVGYRNIKEVEIIDCGVVLPL